MKLRNLIVALAIAAMPSASVAGEPDPLAPRQQDAAKSQSGNVKITTKPLRKPAGSPPAFIEFKADMGGGAVSFPAYKRYLVRLAEANGVPKALAERELANVKVNNRVIELDQGQPGAINRPNYIPPFEPYRKKHVTSSLISRGKARAATHRNNLANLQSRTGVDPGVMMAIYGHETSYGAVTGSFDLLTSLATLAYEGRRRDFFERETIAALQLIQSGHPRSRLKGSWAGATGYPQFMPTTVQRLARDGNGDGVANIWSDEMDGLASIGSYLSDAGWEPNVPWGIPVTVPSTLNRAAIATKVKAPRCERVFARHSQWKSLPEWRKLGIVPQKTLGMPENEMLTLLEPDGPSKTAYLLSQNYRAILDYNCSNFYALSVGLLADEIMGR